MRKTLQILSALAVAAALFYSWLFTLSFINRVNMYRNRDGYKPATFVLKDAEYYPADGDDPFGTWWLNGTVGGQAERLIPGGPDPHSAKELLNRYPSNSTIDALYNPKMTRTMVQGELLRVVVATPDFWENQAMLRQWLGIRVLLPVPITLAIFVSIAYVNRRRRKLRKKLRPVSA